MKIANYADHRVAPSGVMSLKERVEDQRRRIAQNDTFTPEEREKELHRRDALDESKFLLEKQIFDTCAITADAITQNSTTPLINVLRNYVIQ